MNHFFKNLLSGLTLIGMFLMLLSCNEAFWAGMATGANNYATGVRSPYAYPTAYGRGTSVVGSRSDQLFKQMTSAYEQQTKNSMSRFQEAQQAWMGATWGVQREFAEKYGRNPNNEELEQLMFAWYEKHYPDVYSNLTTGKAISEAKKASSSSGGSSSTPSSQSHSQRIKCSLCNGTGKIEKETNAAQYGMSNDFKVRCSECGKEYLKSTGHYHGTCPNCHGKGYR